MKTELFKLQCTVTAIILLAGCAHSNLKMADGSTLTQTFFFMKGKESVGISPKTGFRRSATGQVDSDGINSLGDLLGKVAEGAAKGAGKAVVP